MPDSLPHIHRMEDRAFRIRGKLIGHPNRWLRWRLNHLDAAITKAWKKFRERTDVG